MPNKAENAKQEVHIPKQEVGFAKQEVGSYIGNGGSQSKTDKNLVLGYIYRIHMPSMAKNAEQEVGFVKQEVGSYLGNGVS